MSAKALRKGLFTDGVTGKKLIEDGDITCTVIVHHMYCHGCDRTASACVGRNEREMRHEALSCFTTGLRHFTTTHKLRLIVFLSVPLKLLQSEE